MLKNIKSELSEYSDASHANNLQRFFKTGVGEYGEGDKFIGVKTPVLRQIARKYKNISLEDTVKLLHSPIHEERLLSLIFLVNKYKKFDPVKQEEIYKIYLSNTKYINNWDLVDVTAMHIVGAYLKDKSRKPLYMLAQSKSLWERRIAIIATFHFIKNDEFDETLKIAKILLTDTEDLIHKAVGWMLREVGKRDIKKEEIFLKQYYNFMPRTMLRYAIEKFPKELRQYYLTLK